MLSLVHISDIHLLPIKLNSKFDLFNKRIIGYLNLRYNRTSELSQEYLEKIILSIKAKKPDHWAITGDLVNLALDFEFEQAKKWLAHIDEPQNISLTFGNHEAYIKKSYAKACKTFNEYLKSDLIVSSSFPNVKIRKNVAIISVSSAIATPPFYAAGWFDEAQSLLLAKILHYTREKNLFRIIQIHHPPKRSLTPLRKGLYGIKRFVNVIKQEGCELILHGHTHKDTLTYINEVPLVGVGNTAKFHAGLANYNWFDITNNMGVFNCRLKRYGANSKGEIDLLQEVKLY